MIVDKKNPPSTVITVVLEASKIMAIILLGFETEFVRWWHRWWRHLKGGLPDQVPIGLALQGRLLRLFSPTS
jgi:hypothetical protein